MRKRLRKLLNSLEKSFANETYYQQSVEYHRANEWELAIECLKELGGMGVPEFPKEMWAELCLLAAEMRLDNSKNYCREQIDPIAANTQKKDQVDELGFTSAELEEYDKYVKFYYTNIINSLILYTYKSAELDGMAYILVDPLAELYEELEYAYTPVCFETVFRNDLISLILKQELLTFKTKVNQIPAEIWEWEYLDEHPTWVQIRVDAEEILGKMGITYRMYDDSFTTIISSTGKQIRVITR